MNVDRHYTFVDQICFGVDQALRAICNNARSTERASPALKEAEPILTNKQRQHSAALMRINHSGEVCAQALYHGQAMSAQSNVVKQKMDRAAFEEGDHLTWCMLRISELGSHASYLNFLWYAGAFSIGYAAGLVGDQWSLGFLAETENQVVHHLEKHLMILPKEDKKSYKILQQMLTDEALHRDDAMKAGASELPQTFKNIMSLASNVMVKITYWI